MSLVFDYKKILAYREGEIPTLWWCRHETANGCENCRRVAEAHAIANLSCFQNIDPAMSLLGLWVVAQREARRPPPLKRCPSCKAQWDGDEDLCLICRSPKERDADRAQRMQREYQQTGAMKAADVHAVLGHPTNRFPPEEKE